MMRLLPTWRYGRAIFLVADPRDDIIASEARDEYRISRAADPRACFPAGSPAVWCSRRAHPVDGTGFYQYYRGPLNQLMYEFEDDDLERMKQRVAAKEEWSPLTY
jgi:hypothetical protein